MYRTSYVVVEMHIGTWRKSMSVYQKIRSDAYVHVAAWKEEFHSFPE